ncbi:MAG TPA: hypothetical protein VFZ11_06700 [Gemmatimonadaceae bacterium]
MPNLAASHDPLTSLEAAALRPRTAPELIDAAAVLTRRHYPPLLLLTALGLLASAPVYLGYELLPEHTIAGLPRVAAEVYETLTGCLLGGVMVAAASDAYLGRGVDIPRCLRAAVSRAWPLIVSCVLAMVATLAGLALLVVPGLLVIVRLFAVTPAVVVEGRGALEAIRRSAALSRGIGWKILATVGVPTAAIMAVWIALMLLFEAWTGREASATYLASVVTSLASPFLYVLATMTYYDARIVREGLDLELMTNALGREAEPRGP